MSNLPRILKDTPCFCIRGMATIFLYLGNFQPAELGNFRPAQTEEFSTGTDKRLPVQRRMTEGRHVQLAAAHQTEH